MTSPKKGRKKRKPSDRDDDSDEEFFRNFLGEDFFKELERMAEEFLRMMAGKESYHRVFTGGFRLTVDENGRPKFERIDGSRIIENTIPIHPEEREPHVDMIEGDEEIAVTVEIPNIRKEDIDLRITEDKLEIRAKNSAEGFYKTLELPSRVDPDTARATYRNGILDIVIRRREGAREGLHRVGIE